ncbi:MAG: sigma-70 family RNA polymerase sigma factor [Saprospiraceae bacterium]|nr:sigma-70 family RNA polymerase sigma factor [Saprospiraceae bacterium]
MIDVQIVKRLKKRDKSALTDLYDHYSAAFYGQALRILNNESLAQEAVQDTFLKIWNNIDQYDDRKGRLFTWMYRLARNEAIDRKRSKDFKQSNKTIPLESNVSNTEADDSTATKVDDIGVKQLLNLLDDDTRGILDLVYFQGFTHSEVADLTETPLGTVKTKVRRAIIKLRSVLIKE